MTNKIPDALPVYNLTHAIRLLVVSRCETTLSWDQLRSPQVSQFLLKPIQQEVRATHFSSATQYALMANCLQFNKEISLNPGNSGTSRTRAMVCELIAIKLLKEYTARELIDALSYDFDPLQGQISVSQGLAANTTSAPRPNWEVSRSKSHPRAARISCLEIAIRAQSKRFLAHPMVVQQLEAIWAGSIVFHSAADNLHRPTVRTMPNQNRGYGTSNLSVDPHGRTRLDASPAKLQPAKQREHHENVHLTIRRSVTLYNPRDASLFKLSRLRVPRYRNLLSTCSFAVLLCLFLAVLMQQSLEITVLEIFFWFWTAGYMLDEIVGFNEQGFSLYLASFWNTFDLGILLIFIIHLCLRIYGVVMPDTRKHSIANLAFDILAADAVLLFPRLFSVLDHYRYFSQLLIAFRMMASDLIAIFVLILISCSGFFVALTLGFGNDSIDTPGSVAYALLQILMGYTPAAWDRWSGYNALGKTILTLFLFICHFLVVTILITVLTNSFMAIVQNANEEHQFVFAVNTISMVKSDALFSYVAPTNVIAWFLTPLRYFLPFRRYVKVNRTVIKVTHFPILFLIYLYEKTILKSSMVDAVDVAEHRGRSTASRLFTPRSQKLLREPSVATFRQDRALEEVFRKPFERTLRDTQKSQEQRQSSNVVSNWMRNMESDVVSPPQEPDRTFVDGLERQRSHIKRLHRSGKARDFSQMTRSVASDPEDFTGNNDFLSPEPRFIRTQDTTPSNIGDNKQQVDADHGDKPTANKNIDNERTHSDLVPPMTGLERSQLEPETIREADYFSHRPTEKGKTPEMSTSLASTTRTRLAAQVLDHPKSRRESPSRGTPKRLANAHLRNVSATTIVYNPVGDSSNDNSSSQGDKKRSAGGRTAIPRSGAMTPISKPTSTAAGRRTPKKGVTGPARARPIMPPKDNPGFQSAPNLAGLVMTGSRFRGDIGHRPSLGMDIGSDIGDNKAIGGGYVGAIPASFATQMAYATGGLQRYPGAKEDQDMFGRLMMARMNSLEEGFQEVVHGLKDHLRRQGSRSRSRDRSGGRKPHHSNRDKKRKAQGDNGPKSIEKDRANATSRRQSGDEWVDEESSSPPQKGSSV